MFWNFGDRLAVPILYAGLLPETMTEIGVLITHAIMLCNWIFGENYGA